MNRGRLVASPSLRRETNDALRELGIRPRRSLGQSFLVDERIADRIVDAAAPEGRTVLEIGAGLGTLSARLAQRAASVVLVEIDRVLAEGLRSRFAGQEAVHVIHGDALEIDFATLSSESEPALVVANLPYSVGSQILIRLLEERRRFSVLVLMLQREVAARLVATPGTRDYGLLSIWTAFYGDPKTLFHVSPGAFLPRPKVDSSVVRIVVRPKPRVDLEDPQRFFQVVRASFGQRRKTLRRALRGLVTPEEFERAGIDAGRRGETLSLEEFARLSVRGEGSCDAGAP